jgi:hypothetical protein
VLQNRDGNIQPVRIFSHPMSHFSGSMDGFSFNFCSAWLLSLSGLTIFHQPSFNLCSVKLITYCIFSLSSLFPVEVPFVFFSQTVAFSIA